MSICPRRSLIAQSGNTMLEYGVVAALVLLIAVPGLYLVGGNIHQWTEGVKADMTQHRDHALAVSRQVRARSDKQSSSNFFNKNGKTTEIAGALGRPIPNSPQNGDTTTNSTPDSTNPNGTSQENANTHTIASPPSSTTGTGTHANGQNSPRKNKPDNKPDRSNPGSSTVTSVTGSNGSKRNPLSTTITFGNGNVYTIPSKGVPFTGVAGVGSVKLDPPSNNNAHIPTQVGLGNGHTYTTPSSAQTAPQVAGSHASKKPQITLDNGHTYTIPSNSKITIVTGAGAVRLNPPKSIPTKTTLNNGKSYNTPSPTKSPTLVAGTQARGVTLNKQTSTTKKTSTTKSTTSTKRTQKRKR